MDVQQASIKQSSNASSNSVFVVESSSSFLEEQMPKARKPYTITKQRERWTEEEHKKFLEALQLHGRAWRRIEEHIGTKTTVQIRSHAQKFFTKVSRESSSNGSGSGTAKAIEIPPPRPKRKPSHPYPRKMGTSSINQLEKPFVPKPSIFENENRSPTSVLPDTGFEATNCNSPFAVSAAGSNGSGGLSPAATGREDDTKSSPNQSAMEVDLNSGMQARTLKLFGRTVLLSDSEKNYPSVPEKVLQSGETTASIQICSDDTRGMDMYLQSPQDGSNADFLVESIRGSWNRCLGGASTLFYLPSDKETINSTDAAYAPMPLLAFYGSLPFPFVTAQKQVQPNYFFDAFSNHERMQKEEGSQTGSVDNSGDGNHSDVYLVKAEDTGDVEQEYASRLSANTDVKIESREGFVPYKRYAVDRETQNSQLATESRRGFVPYTRCAVDRVEDPQIVGEDADGQRIESCL